MNDIKDDRGSIQLLRDIKEDRWGHVVVEWCQRRQVGPCSCWVISKTTGGAMQLLNGIKETRNNQSENFHDDGKRNCQMVLRNMGKKNTENTTVLFILSTWYIFRCFCSRCLTSAAASTDIKGVFKTISNTLAQSELKIASSRNWTQVAYSIFCEGYNYIKSCSNFFRNINKNMLHSLSSLTSVFQVEYKFLYLMTSKAWMLFIFNIAVLWSKAWYKYMQFMMSG